MPPQDTTETILRQYVADHGLSPASGEALIQQARQLQAQQQAVQQQAPPLLVTLSERPPQGAPPPVVSAGGTSVPASQDLGRLTATDVTPPSTTIPHLGPLVTAQRGRGVPPSAEEQSIQAAWARQAQRVAAPMLPPSQIASAQAPIGLDATTAALALQAFGASLFPEAIGLVLCAMPMRARLVQPMQLLQQQPPQAPSPEPEARDLLDKLKQFRDEYQKVLRQRMNEGKAISFYDARLFSDLTARIQTLEELLRRLATAIGPERDRAADELRKLLLEEVRKREQASEALRRFVRMEVALSPPHVGVTKRPITPTEHHAERKVTFSMPAPCPCADITIRQWFKGWHAVYGVPGVSDVRRTAWDIAHNKFLQHQTAKAAFASQYPEAGKANSLTSYIPDVNDVTASNRYPTEIDAPGQALVNCGARVLTFFDVPGVAANPVTSDVVTKAEVHLAFKTVVYCKDLPYLTVFWTMNILKLKDPTAPGNEVSVRITNLAWGDPSPLPPFP